MQNEGLVAGNGVHALCARRRLIVGPLLFVEVGTIKPGPLLLVFVPPDQFLALAPGLTVRPCRRAVVQDAHVVRPRESPAVTQVVDRLTFVGNVLVFAGMNAAVNPTATGGGAVGLQVFVALKLLARGEVAAVDLLQNLANVRLGIDAVRAIAAIATHSWRRCAGWDRQRLSPLAAVPDDA